MKKINYISIAMMGILGVSSCSDEFLEEKKDFQFVNPEIYEYYDGCRGRVDNIYNWCLPDVTTANWKYNAVGVQDNQSGSTEEFYGTQDFINEAKEFFASGPNEVPDYFMYTPNNVQAMVYGTIRNINHAIEGISASKGITEEERDELLGQCYFFRAWQYYKMVKWYGGVPLVKVVQDPVPESIVTRSNAKESFEFILDDLDKAAKLLADKTMNGTGWDSKNYGRVTTASALALKGRVLALWCSPMFNRKGLVSRYQEAYKIMIEELDSINKCGHHLFTSNKNINASDFAMMFTNIAYNPEAVFVTLYNTSVADATSKNNNWERYIRPRNTTGTPGYDPSSMFVDLFPMSDGKIPATAGGSAATTVEPTYTKLESSDIAYDPSYPFVGRDPRFYRTFAFPGVRWTYSGDPTQQNIDNPSYGNGTNYELWNYVWYTSEVDRDKDDATRYGGDNLLANVKGMYVRKRSDDYDVNQTPLYAFDPKHSVSGFTVSSAPLIEIRYAEVLLNLAEVACGAGFTNEALQFLRQIRERVGYTGDCGLSESLAADQGACMAAVLYERQIELAYEGKRFDDLRRWMLFDGGLESVDGAPATWTLGGLWANGTTNFLGFRPLNGQRREGLEFRVKNDVAHNYCIGTDKKAGDPMTVKGIERCMAVDYRNPDLESQLAVLKDWYEANLERFKRKGDSRDDKTGVDYKILFRPKYYFLGFKSGALNHNTAVEQTIGWDDTRTSGMGTFDPLEE